MAGNRQFIIRPAKREAVPIILGIVGPSGSGKTYSALRIATGIQRVQPGPITVIDTEANRAKMYADRFSFDHLPFGAPFSPLDYLEAIEACVAHGSRTIVVDSMSHEHEGPGGVLEWAHAEAEEMSRRSERNGRGRPPEAFTMPSFAAPKAARRRMLNSIIQLGCNVIMCFRAKEKIKLPDRQKNEREPTQLGWQPIAGEEIVFEMVTQFLLLPGSDGVPCFAPEHEAERAVIKRPDFFRQLLSKPEQLSEDLGEKMARWASGGEQPAKAEPLGPSLLERVQAASSEAECTELAAEYRAKASAMNKPDRDRLSVAFKDAKARLADAPTEKVADGYRDNIE